MTDPEIQELVVRITQIRLRLRTAKEKDVIDFLETVYGLEFEELYELEARNPMCWEGAAL